MDIISDQRATKIQTLPLVRIRPLLKKDINHITRWMTSSYILQHSFVIKSPKLIPHDFATESYAERYFDLLLNDHKRRSFAIIHHKNPVGSIGLKDINHHEKKAECFIEIGDAQSRGCGIGYLAMKQLLHIAFELLALQIIELDVLEFNMPALKIYHRLGFKPVNKITWHHDEYGQYWKVLKMALIKDDYA